MLDRPVLALMGLLVLASVAHADEPRPRLVIVTPAGWEAHVEPLAALRRQGGLEVDVVALEDVLARADGRDAPERIKRFLWTGWREHGVRYALLVGDSDTFPVRFMVLDRCTTEAHDTAFYGCDLYYGDVARADGSFDDWNGNADGHHAAYFGEVQGEKVKAPPINLDAISYVPEVAIGRWPVSTPEALRAVVEKTVAWEARAVGPARARRALAVHAGGWVDARGPLRAWTDALVAAGWQLDRHLYGDPVEPSPARAMSALREGRELAVHAGHGWEDGWADVLGPAEREALGSAPPSVLFSVGCGTAVMVTQAPYQGYLDVDGVVHRGTNAGEVFRRPPPPPAPLQPGRFDATSFGERLVRAPGGGAVAYIGCNTGSQPCALTLLEGFLASTARPADQPRRLGDAWVAAIAHYWRAQRLADLVPTDDWYPPSIFFQGMKFVVLGDPSLPLP